jgi:xylulose-5-phosphate/fructose-6-phosphate phosphoketolase
MGRKRLKQQLQHKLIAHTQYIGRDGENLPEIRNWTWIATNTGKPA